MAGKLGEAFVTLSLQDQQFKRGLVGAESMTRQSVSRMSGMLGRIGVGGLGAMGVVALGKAWARNVEEFAKREARMTGLLRSLGHTSRKTRDDLDAMADSFKKAFGVDDDAVKDAMIEGLQFGVPVAQVEDFIRTAMGLAKVLDTDLKGGVEGLTKAYNGNFAALERQLPTLKRFADDEGKLAELFRLANIGLEQQVEYAVGAAAGIAEVRNAWDDLGEAIATSKISENAARMLGEVTKLASMQGEAWKRAFFGGIGTALGVAGQHDAAEQVRKLAERFDEDFREKEEAIARQRNRAAGKGPTELMESIRRAMAEAKKEAKAAREAVRGVGVEFLSLEDVWKRAQEDVVGGGVGRGRGGVPARRPSPVGVPNPNNPLDNSPEAEAMRRAGGGGPTTVKDPTNAQLLQQIRDILKSATFGVARFAK